MVEVEEAVVVVVMIVVEAMTEEEIEEAMIEEVIEVEGVVVVEFVMLSRREVFTIYFILYFVFNFSISIDCSRGSSCRFSHEGGGGGGFNFYSNFQPIYCFKEVEVEEVAEDMVTEEIEEEEEEAAEAEAMIEEEDVVEEVEEFAMLTKKAVVIVETLADSPIIKSFEITLFDVYKYLKNEVDC